MATASTASQLQRHRPQEVRKEDKVKFNRVEKLTLTVSCPQLESVNFNGAGDIDASRLDCKDFSSRANGLGSIKRPKN